MSSSVSGVDKVFQVGFAASPDEKKRNTNTLLIKETRRERLIGAKIS